jgi:hypothetical protein
MMSAMRDNLPGCSLIVLLFALVASALAVLNLRHGNEDLQRLDRMRKVLAVITDKGVATHEQRDQGPRRLGEATKESQYWIRFECQIGGAIRQGSRISLFPLDEDSLWERYEKGKQYEAHYDPDRDECILVVDEPRGGVRKRYILMLLACGIAAALALAVFVATRRRRGAGEATPAGPGA